MTRFVGQRRRNYIIYFIGVMVLGLVYHPVKTKVDDTWFVVICVTYLLVLRSLGTWVERHFNN